MASRTMSCKKMLPSSACSFENAPGCVSTAANALTLKASRNAKKGARSWIVFRGTPRILSSNPASELPCLAVARPRRDQSIRSHRRRRWRYTQLRPKVPLLAISGVVMRSVPAQLHIFLDTARQRIESPPCSPFTKKFTPSPVNRLILTLCMTCHAFPRLHSIM